VRPVRPSAIFADSRLSTPPRSVKDSAAGSSSSSRAGVMAGSAGIGKLRGMPPVWLPMVSNSRDGAWE